MSGLGRRLVRVAWPPLTGAAAVVHGSAVMLLVLVLTIESSASGGDPASLLRRVALLWAQLAPALTVIASALAWFRMRKARLALGTLGLTEGTLRWATLPLAIAIGCLALAVPAQGAPAAWIRGTGGWIYLGQTVPDVVGGTVTLLPPKLAWGVFAACIAAGPVGAVTRPASSLAVIVVASLLAEALHPGGGAGVLSLAGLVLLRPGRYSQPTSVTV